MESKAFNREERDLLIQLNERMTTFGMDLREMKDGLNERMKSLEQTKLDRTEANRLQSESLDFHVEIKKRVNGHDEAIEELQTDAVIRDTETKTLIKVAAAANILIQLVIAIFAVYVAYKFH